MKNKKRITFKEYLKNNDFEYVVMNDNSYKWDNNRTTLIREKFRKDYFKKYGYTKFNRFEIMDT